LKLALIYLLIIILIYLVEMTENKRYTEFPSEKIIKSQQDDREYKLITLENELDVLLIHDVIYIILIIIDLLYI